MSIILCACFSSEISVVFFWFCFVFFWFGKTGNRPLYCCRCRPNSHSSWGKHLMTIVIFCAGFTWTFQCRCHSAWGQGSVFQCDHKIFVLTPFVLNPVILHCDTASITPYIGLIQHKKWWSLWDPNKCWISTAIVFTLHCRHYTSKCKLKQ